MTNDWKALCAELLRGLDENRHPEVRYPGHLRLVMAAARTLLAQPEPEGPTPQPADGEVAELVEWLRLTANEQPHTSGQGGIRLTRAADLLERLNPPQPVPLSERPWEREGWCDENGYCWWFDSADPGWVFDDSQTCRYWAEFVLPAHALTVPTSENV